MWGDAIRPSTLSLPRCDWTLSSISCPLSSLSPWLPLPHTPCHSSKAPQGLCTCCSPCLEGTQNSLKSLLKWLSQKLHTPSSLDLYMALVSFVPLTPALHMFRIVYILSYFIEILLSLGVWKPRDPVYLVHSNISALGTVPGT